jgi:putative methyltransferase (TIGR04325 family)
MIPIIFIHFGVPPLHLINALNQALIYNKKVFLIGDTDFKLNGVQTFPVTSYLDGVAEFETAYVHMSTNEAGFEKICIKRWLILNNFLKQNTFSVCYYSDSDVMIYDNLTKVYENYKEYDASYTFPEYQENFRWTASACCSFWKDTALNKFAKFIKDIYSKEKITVLEEKWNYHKKNNIAGGVCDMTLLYLFAKQIKFFSLSLDRNNLCFDQNFIDSENYYKNEFEMERLTDLDKMVKKISWENGLPHAYNLILKNKIRFIALTEYARYINQKRSFTEKILIIARRIKGGLKRRASKILKPKETPSGWFGDYKTWEEAEKECSGYDSKLILQTVKSAVIKVKNGEAAYERDSVLFDSIQYSNGLLKAFKNCIKEDKLHVTDFGGSLGSSYFQHKSLFETLAEFKWSVVEQKHFVDCGKSEITTGNLNFYYTVDEALKNQTAHVLFLSSVVQYFKQPYELISELQKYNFDYIIVDRTAFVLDSRERITKQVVPESIYKASYPAWFFNEEKFISAFTDKYELIEDFKSAFDPEGELQDGAKVYRKGFYFKLKNKHA